VVLEKQTLATCNGRPCDIMEVRDQSTGDGYTLYFDIAVMMEHMSAVLGGEPSN